MSDKLIMGLIIAYGVIMAVSLWERNYNRALYWVGAIVLQVSILRMK